MYFSLFRLGQVRLGYVTLGYVSLGYSRLGQARLGQVRLGQVRLGQVRLGQVRLGQVRLGQVRLGQVGLDKPRCVYLLQLYRDCYLKCGTTSCSTHTGSGLASNVPLGWKLFSTKTLQLIAEKSFIKFGFCRFFYETDRIKINQIQIKARWRKTSCRNIITSNIQPLAISYMSHLARTLSKECLRECARQRERERESESVLCFDVKY